MTTSRFPSRGQRNSDMPSAAHRVSLPQRESTWIWLIHGPNLARCQRHGLAYTRSPCSRIRLARRAKSLSDGTSAKPLRRPVCRRCIAPMTCVMSGEFFPLGVDEPLMRDDGESLTDHPRTSLPDWSSRPAIRQIDPYPAVQSAAGALLRHPYERCRRPVATRFPRLS